MLKTLTDHRSFSPTVQVLWAATVILLLYNAVLQIKINKAHIKDNGI